MADKFIFTDLTAIIADYKYYTMNELAIDEWLENHDSERKGMVIKFADEQIKMMFVMKWV